MELQYRPLGSSGLRVASLFLGAMTFGEQGGVGAPIEECRRMVDAYEAVGGNVIDTAINYRGGLSEEVLGEVLAGKRDRFVVATKFGITRDGTDPNASGSHRKNLRLSIETSLRRLKTDYIDLYWVHINDAHTPIDVTMAALDDAVSAGKILTIGISDTPAWIVSRAQALAEWRGWSPVVGLQVPYSLLQRDIERELLPAAEAHGMTVAAWSPLGGGVLSGKYQDAASLADSAATRRLSNDSITDRQRAVAAAVIDVARQLNTAPAAVAVAWTMARSPNIHPIIGARTAAQLQDNLAAAEVELTDEMLTHLEAEATIALGFPHDFTAEVTNWVFGEANQRTAGRLRPIL